MSSTLSSDIKEDENLFRGIHATQWDELRPSSAAFKDRKGLSVDRCNYRPDAEAISFLLSSKSYRGIVKIPVTYVKSIPTKVIYAPVDGNEFHSEIHDMNKVELTRGNARKFASEVEIVFESLH